MPSSLESDLSFAANSRDDRLKVFAKCIQPLGSRNLAKGGASHEVHCVILLGAVLSVRGSEGENEMLSLMRTT